MKKVIVTIRLAVKTDPNDEAQLVSDVAEMLQEYIDDGNLNEILDLDDAEEEDEYDDDEDF